MSADGIRISYVPSKSMELGKYMANVLDEQWKELRGMEIQSVGIASISYDETSQELINMRNKGAMMGDPSVREGYVQTTIAEGLKGAGTNSNGAMAGYMGMGFGMQNSGAFMGSRFRNQYAADADEPADAAGTADAIWNRKWRLPGRTDGLWSSKCRRPGSPAKRRLQISRGSVLPAMWKTQENSAASVENQGLP